MGQFSTEMLINVITEEENYIEILYDTCRTAQFLA